MSDESLMILLEELRVDDKLHFVEEPVEVMDREIKQLKRSRIPIIKEHKLWDHREPANNRDTLFDLEFDKWLKYMNAKMQSKDNNFWNLIDIPPIAYFSNNSMVLASRFEEKFWMSQNLFTSIVKKYTSAIRQLAYDTVPDNLDEYLQKGQATARLSLEQILTYVMDIFGPYYLRKPTIFDIGKLYERNEEKHGLPRMLGCLDCTDWEWFGCPVTHKAQYCRHDLGPDPFILIYPEWVPFVNSVTNLFDGDYKRLRYKRMHEGAKKDVERAFGALKNKWAILATPARADIKEKLVNIMYT
ncbi:retrovirus-related pol polyprotein from transposon TNT 1-94 [Tanacetum coccineum]